VIELQTQLGDDPKMSMRYEWFRNLHALSHDAAVAHALLRAIDNLGKKYAGLDVCVKIVPIAVLAQVRRDAVEILRDDFGIQP